MRPVGACLVAGLFAATACGGSPPGLELGEAACSNGQDDDRDGMTDCADPACSLFAWCTRASDAGTTDATADGLSSACRAVDVIFVVDVSSSMEPEVAELRSALPRIEQEARARGLDMQMRLVAFVDDVVAVDMCRPLADAAAVDAELVRVRAIAAMDHNLVSSVRNSDCPENVLDALATVVTTCAARPGAERIAVLLTDDTFIERPGVLSGAYGPGVLVQATYAEVSGAMVRERIPLIAVARSGAGEPCAAGQSLDVGRGLFSEFSGMSSLPMQTGGLTLDTRMPVDLTASLVDFAAGRSGCR